MKRIQTILLIMLSTTISALSQGDVYYDSLWNETVKEKAHYYRTIDTIENGLYQVKDHFITGEIQMHGHYTSIKKEKKIGKFQWFYKNGRLKSETEYVNNKPEGLTFSWYENGRLQFSGSNHKGKQQGYWIWFYKNGNPKHETFFTKGKNDKYFKAYHMNGKLASFYQIKNGKPNGDLKLYYANGRQITHGHLEDGKPTGKFVLVDSLTPRRTEMTFLDKKLNVDVKMYHGNGRLMTEIFFKKGKPHSKVEMWFDNGVLAMDGEVKKGYKVGRWVTYDRKGNVKNVEHFTKKDKEPFNPGVNPALLFGKQ